MSFTFQRTHYLRTIIAKAAEKEAKDVKEAAGLKVTDEGDPEYGIYAHQIAGQPIGHTVKAVHDGTIAWSAVPVEGKIKGKFKNHEDAKQYLADQHGAGIQTKAIQEAATATAKPVKKSEELVEICKDWASFDAQRGSAAGKMGGGYHAAVNRTTGKHDFIGSKGGRAKWMKDNGHNWKSHMNAYTSPGKKVGDKWGGSIGGGVNGDWKAQPGDEKATD